jgi:hypothetical protein
MINSPRIIPISNPIETRLMRNPSTSPNTTEMISTMFLRLSGMFAISIPDLFRAKECKIQNAKCKNLDDPVK